MLHIALGASGVTQSALAGMLKIRKSAVNQVLRGDGNLRVKTLAEYLNALGYELDVRLVEAGEPRKAALEGRSAALAPAMRRVSELDERTSVGLHGSDATPTMHVLPGVDRDLLMEIRVHPVGSQSTEFRFEGRVHVVSKDPLPSAFVPLKTPEVI
jgi:transcriptional regulator with XRE-family HTH domain